MKSFISSIIDDILSKQQEISNLKFVLPSQRACVFLKDELLKKLTKATFLPKIVSIENFIQELADVYLIDNIQLLFEFYNIYNKVMPVENRESFESFSQWATIALHDFNEIDSYLIDTNNFFLNLRDIKQLNKWFQNKKPSKLSENYLQFFEYLNKMYNLLYTKLKDDKVGYQGLIYREATENLEYFIQTNQKTHIVFIGFNALNSAEEFIFQELLNNNLASIYWDVNESIINKNNEAGLFIKKYKNEWAYYQHNEFLWCNSDETKNQEIQIIGAPKNVGQIKFAGELLSNFKNLDNTALVLADENLLNLTLNSLPNNVKNVNITMGYPLKDMPIAGIFSQLFKLHLNQQKFNLQDANTFYFKDVFNVLNNSFLNKLFQNKLQQISLKIKKENKIFISVNDIENFMIELKIKNYTWIISLLKFSKNVNEIIRQCSILIFKMKDFVTGIEKEYLFRFYEVFQQLELLNLKYQYITNIKTLNQFYNLILKNEKLSFRGEPLQGLQLMGMLETRTLDFENIIITSVNEGILPGGKNDFSFIPFDVKKHFKLPTYLEKDAIFSYHFQRLLQRAKKVYLIYNTETDGYGSGEKSRFLTKLAIENSKILDGNVGSVVQKTEIPLIEIQKNNLVLNQLKEVFTKGISPSALTTYIYNPIKFYEQKVLGIFESDEVEETIAANTMGTVIHEVLKELYIPFINKNLLIENIEVFLEQLDDFLMRNFNKIYKNGSVNSGKNKLIFEVSRNYLLRFLNSEKELLQDGNELKIIAVEEKLQTTINIEGIDFPVKIEGIVDRIDILNGSVRIIDYKTGKVDSSNLKLPDVALIKEDYKYSKSMQVMLYAYLYSQKINYNFTNSLEAGIISFKNLNNGFLKVNFSDKRGVNETIISKEILDKFITEVSTIIKDILNPEKPFLEKENLPF